MEIKVAAPWHHAGSRRQRAHFLSGHACIEFTTQSRRSAASANIFGRNGCAVIGRGME